MAYFILRHVNIHFKELFSTIAKCDVEVRCYFCLPAHDEPVAVTKFIY